MPMRIPDQAQSSLSRSGSFLWVSVAPMVKVARDRTAWFVAEGFQLDGPSAIRTPVHENSSHADTGNARALNCAGFKRFPVGAELDNLGHRQEDSFVRASFRRRLGLFHIPFLSGIRRSCSGGRPSILLILLMSVASLPLSSRTALINGGTPAASHWVRIWSIQ